MGVRSLARFNRCTCSGVKFHPTAPKFRRNSAYFAGSRPQPKGLQTMVPTRWSGASYCWKHRLKAASIRAKSGVGVSNNSRT
jgi:hypothetical protein